MTQKGNNAGGSGDKDPLKVDPTSLTFDVRECICHTYADATHLEMVQTLNDAVCREAAAAGEELKTLIRESMGTFIGYKETMDTMHANDKPLFTGEALDPITDAFQSALEDGEALVAPTLKLFEDLRSMRLTKETLAKLMAMWRVPGLIYEHCGVRIASRRSDDARLYDSLNAARGGKNKREVSSADSDDDESRSRGSSARDTDDEKDDDDDDDDEDNARANAADLLARGALEFAVGGDDDDFVLHPGEELRYWYGTAIAQLRNPIARRRAIEERSNYEAAVLSLRRAMLYLEENYDLERAVVLGEDESDAAELLPLDGTRTPAAEKPEFSMILTCQYAMALLRAALYLNKQLSYELRQASASDTVLIEDTLSAMMDVSIATVKLRHFCWAARAVQRSDEAAAGDTAFSRLRHHSEVTSDEDEDEDEDDEDEDDEDENNNGDDEDETRSGQSDVDGAALSGSLGQSESTASMRMSPVADRSLAATPAAGAWPAAPSTGPRCRAQHPVEFYVRITRHQHTRLMEASARRARRDALNWRQKFMPNVSQQRPAAAAAASTAGPAGRRGSALLFDSACAAALLGAGGALLGNPADSFIPSKASYMGMETTSETTVGETINERIRVSLLDEPDGDSSQLFADADAILEAFRTPEANFGKFTTFRIGEEDMGVVLECSAAQLAMQSRGILHQIAERADVEVDVAVHAAAVNTFVSRLFEACLEHMELVLASYWGGIATAIHAGVFDFDSDESTPLGRMLHGPAALADGTSEAQRSRRNTRVSSINNSSVTAMDNHSVPAPLKSCTGASEADHEDSGLPPLLFVPVVARNTGGLTLRQFSVAAVRRGVRAAGDILHTLLLASANCEVVQAFVRTMAAYREEDLGRGGDGCGRGEGEGDEGGSERVELHAAILVELLLAQWERAMTQASETILRMKIVVGESCTTASVSSDAQAQEIGELLEELEQLRSMLLRCYTHAVGLLAKAYVTLLPSLEPPISVQTAVVNEGKRSVASVRARISRDYVSSVMTNKLLNLLSVVVDRTAPFLQRYDEIFNGIDLFAAEAEGRDEAPSTSRGNTPRRTRVLRRQQTKESSQQQQQQQQQQQVEQQQLDQEQEQQGNPEAMRLPGEGQLDPVTAFMAQCNSRMALDHTAEHEEMILALVANILLVFVDMLHYRCQCASSATDASDEARERAIVESLADVLCLPTSVAPIVANELVAPCVLSVVAALSTTNNPREPHMSAVLERKLEHFRADYLSRVGEHCQLAVDAMLNMFLCAPQQLLTREVRSAGFLMPMLDWQRVSAHTAGAVRPYVTDALVHIARAHESLQLLRQPLLGAAVTQRLVAHFAFAFLTALTADGNAFEISPDCSAAFLTHGLILLEAEARTILGIVDALAKGPTESPGSACEKISPELCAAREALVTAAAALRRYGGAMCDDIPFTAKQREERCDAMVAAAMARSRYLVQAIITYAEDRTVAAAFRPAAAAAAPERLAERLARRADGYRLAHTARRPEKREKPNKGEKNEKRERPNRGEKNERRETAEKGGTEEEFEDDEVGALTLRIAKRVSVLEIATELAARAALEEAMASAKKEKEKGIGYGEKEGAMRRDEKTRTRTQRTVQKEHTTRGEQTGVRAAQTKRFKRNLAL